MTSQPCPVCSALDGFHDEAPHLAARGQIPRRLILPTAAQRKAARLAEPEPGDIPAWSMS